MYVNPWLYKFSYFDINESITEYTLLIMCVLGEKERVEGIITSKFWDRTPASKSMGGDICDELLIFFRRP